MKRILSFALMLIMAFSLAGCVKQQSGEAAPTEIPGGDAQAPSAAPSAEPSAEPEPTEQFGYMPATVIQGESETFFLYPDGALYGCGVNDFGQLGVGDTGERRAPVFIATGLTPVVVGDTVLALSSDGVLWGWGRNDRGQLGTGDTEDRLRPVELMYFIKQAAEYGGRFMALTETGELYRWGDPAEAPEPQLYMENIRCFSDDGVYITNDNELYIEGADIGPVCGGVRNAEIMNGAVFIEGTDGRLYARYAEKNLLLTDDWKDYACSGGKLYVLNSEGLLLAMDMEELDILRWNAESEAPFKLVLEDVREFLATSQPQGTRNNNYCFAIKENGELWSWGEYAEAYLGRGADFETTNEPKCVAEGVNSVICVGLTTFAVTDAGRVLACGYGGLGDGTNTIADEFKDIGLKEIRSVYTYLRVVYDRESEGADLAAFYPRAFAIDSLGRIFAWGDNAGGRLAVNSAEDIVLAPIEVHMLRD